VERVCNHDARLHGEFNGVPCCYACELARVVAIAEEAKRLLSVVPMASVSSFYGEIAEAYRVLNQLEKVE
jgi:hypothetical protein